MQTYHEMYLKLASATADAVCSLQSAAKKLILAQREAEEILLRGDGEEEYGAAVIELRKAVKTPLPGRDPAERRGG